jgi:hypothetical protein
MKQISACCKTRHFLVGLTLNGGRIVDFCLKCNQPCDLLWVEETLPEVVTKIFNEVAAAKRNKGLTGIEIYEQRDDILEFRRGGEGEVGLTLFTSNIKWDELTASFWTVARFEVLKRKSEAVKQEEPTPAFHREGADKIGFTADSLEREKQLKGIISFLHHEVISLREQQWHATAMLSEMIKSKNKEILSLNEEILQKKDIIRHRDSEIALLAEKYQATQFIYKNWPQEKPTKDFCICVLRKGPAITDKNTPGYIYTTATFRSGGFYTRQMRLSGAEEFQFLELPE